MYIKYEGSNVTSQHFPIKMPHSTVLRMDRGVSPFSWFGRLHLSLGVMLQVFAWRAVADVAHAFFRHWM